MVDLGHRMTADETTKLKLSGAGDGPGHFLFHLVLFPAAELLSQEDFGVVASIARFNTSLRCRIEDLFADPSLPEAYS